jgi:hypothetical protein
VDNGFRLKIIERLIECRPIPHIAFTKHKFAIRQAFYPLKRFDAAAIEAVHDMNLMTCAQQL